MPRLIVPIVFALCFAAWPALAGTNVTGTLWLSSSAHARAIRSGVAENQPTVGEGVVWVESIPAKLEAKLAAPKRGWFGLRKKSEPPLPSVAQRDDRFSPKVLAVPTGSHVELANRDRFYHSPFSVSEAKRFDLGKTVPGRRDTLTFGRAGVVNMHCEIHPNAVGYVVVTPNRAYATPDSMGHFSIPRLPKGRYVLHAWHPRMGELKLPFDVPKRGAVALDPSF
jgi:hypothetical protein